MAHNCQQSNDLKLNKDIFLTEEKCHFILTKIINMYEIPMTIVHEDIGNIS